MLTAVWEIESKAAERGKKLASAAHYRDLALAREVAKELAQTGFPISADVVKAETLRRFPDMAWGNFAGNLFSGPYWAPAGWVKSTAKGCHGRAVRLWVLR